MATMRNSAGINKAGGRNVNPVYKAVNTVTSYVGNVGREIRDIPTAIGASLTSRGPGFTSYKRKSTLMDQVKEAAAAVTTGQKGSSVAHKTAVGDFKDSKRRK